MVTVTEDILGHPWATWSDIPPYIKAQIEAAGIHSPADWRRAGARKYGIFGVTSRTVERIDRVVAGWLL
jgi:hypothetical protein